MRRRCLLVRPAQNSTRIFAILVTHICTIHLVPCSFTVPQALRVPPKYLAPLPIFVQARVRHQPCAMHRRFAMSLACPRFPDHAGRVSCAPLALRPPHKFLAVSEASVPLAARLQRLARLGMCVPTPLWAHQSRAIRVPSATPLAYRQFRACAWRAIFVLRAPRQPCRPTVDLVNIVAPLVCLQSRRAEPGHFAIRQHSRHLLCAITETIALRQA